MQDESILNHYHDVLERRRDIAYEVFSSIPGVTAVKPESGNLSWINISKLGTSKEVAAYILEHAKISVNEGSPYGPLCGEGHLRIVHACFVEEMRAKEAFEKIKEALITLAEEKNLHFN